jgi:hypothetical protein
LERQITVGGRRGVLSPTVQPDGNNGICTVHVSVPSDGSYYLGIGAGGIHTGVRWDVCAKVVLVLAGIGLIGASGAVAVGAGRGAPATH